MRNARSDRAEVVSSSQRSGFTLIELMVVISIVGLLVALLLPAVTAAREAARRVHCLGNLRQFGIAIAAYHDRNAVLPPGRMKCYDPRYSFPIPGCSANLVDKSILVFLLPEIEQVSLYNAINHNLSIFSRENTSIHTVSVSVFTCPSDPESGYPRPILADILTQFGVPDPPSGRNLMVTTSYGGLSGSFAVNALPNPVRNCQVDPISLGQNNGTFCDAWPIRFSSITDGLSNTAFMTEKATAPLRQVQQPISRLPFEQGGWYVNGNFGMTLVSSFYRINAYKVVPSLASQALTTSASSLHPGGVNVLMGDGSVRFIRETIDSWPFDPLGGTPVGAVLNPDDWWDHVPAPGVWQAITTRSGGESSHSDEY